MLTFFFCSLCLTYLVDPNFRRGKWASAPQRHVSRLPDVYQGKDEASKKERGRTRSGASTGSAP